MGVLSRRADERGRLFAPFVFKLGLKLEQVPWKEAIESASDAIFVLRSAQRLFKLDAVCCGLDTWLEAEAAGAIVERDEYGRVFGQRSRSAELQPIEDVLGAAPLSTAIEITRRLSVEADTGVLPLAGVTVGATLIERLGLGEGDKEYANRLALAVAKAHLDAGAAGLVLLEEEVDPDLTQLSGFAALFNLASYHDVPVFLLSRHQVSPQGLKTLEGLGGELFVTPDETSRWIDASFGQHEITPDVAARFCCSRWELDPDTDPDALQGWRQRVMSN